MLLTRITFMCIVILLLCGVVQVLDFKTPQEIPLLIDLSIRDAGVDDKELLALCEKALSLSVHTGIHNMAFTLLRRIYNYYILFLYLSIC